MSWKLAKKDISLLIRNPVTYLGLILMVGIVIFTVSPFWNLYGNVRDAQSPVIYDSDGEIEAGYIPTPTETVYQNAMQELRQGLISDCGFSEDAADKEIQKIQESGWSIDQIAEYFKDNYSYTNMGTYDPSSGYLYRVRPFALFVRFPMLFSELVMPKGALWNACFAFALSVILLIASELLWERRRGG